MTDNPGSPSDDASALRSGFRVSLASLAWTLATSKAAIFIGLTQSSLVLVAFGAVGLLDALGSATLVIHFRHALHHEALSAKREQLALRVVTIGLLVVSLSTAIASIVRLLGDSHSEPSLAALGLAAISAVGLSFLATRKRRLGLAIPSHALTADGWLSSTGAALGGVTLLGTGLNRSFGWEWADPLAALIVALGAIAMAWHLRRSAPD